PTGRSELSVMSQRLHQFDAIAERIRDVNPMETFQRFVGHNRIAGFSATPDEIIQPCYQQRGVRFLCRPEILLYSKVDFERAIFKPYAAAFGQMFGLWFLGQAEDAAIETPCPVFPFGRHGELYVFDGV